MHKTPLEFWTPGPIPAIPQRNRLYSPEPIGIGTSQVESLTSYMCRLAESHCLSAGALYLRSGGSRSQSFFDHLTPYKATRAKGRSIGTAHDINGLGLRAEDWTEALGVLTGRENLPMLTVLSLRGMVSGLHLLREKQAWCPDCFKQDKELENPEHNRLIWCFESLSRCLVHNAPLSTLCPFCGKSQIYISASSLPGYCAHCDQWLGNQPKASEKYQEAPSMESFTGRFLSELLESFPDIALSSRSKALHATNLQTNLLKLIDHIAEGNVALFSKIVGVRPESMNGWLPSEGHAPSLDNLLRVASTLCVSADALVSREISESEFLDLKSKIDACGFRSTKRRPKADQLSKLVEASRSDECLSLPEVAKELGYTGFGSLYRLDAELCQIIRRRHSEKRRAFSAVRRNMRLRTDDEISAVLEWHLATDYPPTIDAIARELGYEQSGRTLSKFPQVRAIMEKRREYERRAKTESIKLLEDGLQQDPPPTFEEIRQRVGNSLYRWLLSTEAGLVRQLRVAQEAHRRKQLRVALESALSETPPQPLTVVCKTAGYSYDNCFAWFPDIAKAIVSRAREYRSAERVRKRVEMEEEVFRLVQTLCDAGIAPGCQTVIASLEKGGTCAYDEIGRAIIRARQLLGLSKLRG
jgi:hypothetical protein